MKPEAFPVGSMQDDELVTEGQNFQLQGSTRSA